MSGVKDPFEILADEITLIRRQMDHLQRTSLSKDEAEAFNATIAKFIAQLGKTAPAMQEAMRRDLAYVGHDVRKHAVEAAQGAAREAIEKSHAESIRAAQSLSQAAGEARRQAWRYFGGFWVWLASIGAAGALLGVLAAFWITGRGDAREFGQYPRIYCKAAGGTFADQRDGSRYCIFMVSPPTQPAAE